MSESPLLLSQTVEAPAATPSLPRGSSSPVPDDPADADEPRPAPARPVREGLPSHYRMRAEPHYVEALARPRMETPPAPPPEGKAPAASRALCDAANAVSRALGSVAASLGELPAAGRPLRERVLVDLARAEAIRAGWLAEALAVMHREPLPVLDQVNLGDVVAQVSAALGAEHRLTGQAPVIVRSEIPVRVFGDERLAVVALGGLVQAMCDLAAPAGDLSRVVVRVAPIRDGRSRGIEVSQSAVRVPAAVLDRFFDLDWPEHPAGSAGAVSFAAARRIAAAQGGALDARVLDGGGCAVLLSLPAAE